MIRSSRIMFWWFEVKIHFKKLYPFLIPYIAVITGLYFLKNAWISILLYHVMIIAYIVATGRISGFRKIKCGWNVRLMFFSCVVSVLAGPALFAFWDLMTLKNSDPGLILTGFHLNGISWTLFIPYFCLIHPGLEEVFWRGNSEKDKVTGIFRDILFGGYHVLVLVLFIKLEWVIISFLLLTFISIMWNSISQKTHGLLIPLLSHTVTDTSIIIAANIILNRN